MITLTKDHIDFNAIRFTAAVVRKALPVDREFKRYIFVEGGTAYGTDGKRLHTAEVQSIEPGWYRVAKNTKTKIIISKEDVDADYPDTKDITVRKGYREVDICPDSLDALAVNTCYINMVNAVPGLAIRYNFFEEALNLIGDVAATISVKDLKHPVVIKEIGGSSCRAYIMPFKM